MKRLYTLIIPALVSSSTGQLLSADCRDEPTFAFVNNMGKTKRCNWIANRKEKRAPRYCQKKEISFACPDACDTCPAETCSEKCFKNSLFTADVCDDDSICSSCMKSKPLLKTCKFLWNRCNHSDSHTYGGLDCSDIHSIHKCYKEKVPATKESLVGISWTSNPIPAADPLSHNSTRYQWIHSRKPYEPINAETTVIAGVLFTLSEFTLKMSVLFPPLYRKEATRAYLNVRGKTSFSEYETECDIIPYIWLCSFRLDGIPQDEVYTYVVSYYPKPGSQELLYTYDGEIPLQQGKPNIAALSCFGHDDTMSKDELVDAVLHRNPDLIVLQGDQTYFHTELGYGFLETIYSLNRLTRSIPTIVQMDDHDYGQGNFWGAANGPNDSSGAGFTNIDACLSVAVEKKAMSHNPDPVSTNVLSNGVKYQFTNYVYDKVDFAILETRKFKNRRNYDSLLGYDQELWLQSWCNNNVDKMKVVLAQTPFISVPTHRTSYEEGVSMMEIKESSDTNSFPPSGRARALDILQECSQLVISGDQHVSFAVTYPDYDIHECTSPAAVNTIFWRTNDKPIGITYNDNFGHQYTLHNIWNVPQDLRDKFDLPGETIGILDDATKRARGDGFLMVHLGDSTATCEAHSYRDSAVKLVSDLIWRVEVAAQ